jgi:hypothetical protein
LKQTIDGLDKAVGLAHFVQAMMPSK